MKIDENQVRNMHRIKLHHFVLSKKLIKIVLFYIFLQYSAEGLPQIRILLKTNSVIVY